MEKSDKPFTLVATLGTAEISKQSTYDIIKVEFLETLETKPVATDGELFL